MRWTGVVAAVDMGEGRDAGICCAIPWHLHSLQSREPRMGGPEPHLPCALACTWVHLAGVPGSADTVIKVKRQFGPPADNEGQKVYRI